MLRAGLVGLRVDRGDEVEVYLSNSGFSKQDELYAAAGFRSASGRGIGHGGCRCVGGGRRWSISPEASAYAVRGQLDCWWLRLRRIYCGRSMSDLSPSDDVARAVAVG